MVKVTEAAHGSLFILLWIQEFVRLTSGLIEDVDQGVTVESDDGLSRVNVDFTVFQ